MAWTVWQEKDKIYLLDGVGRKLLYEEKEKKGENPPKKVYCNFLDLKNKKEAAKAVLILSSQYRKINDDGLNEFLNKNDLIKELPELITQIDIPEFDIDKFIESNFEIEEKNLDEIPEAPKKALSKIGDIFEIDNKHRLLCGDLTEQENINKLLNGIKPEICIADPPYDIDENLAIKMINIIENNIIGNSFILCTDKLCATIFKNTKLKFHGFLICLLNIPIPINYCNYFYRKHIPILHLYNSKINWINTYKGYTTVFEMNEYRHHSENSELHPHNKPVDLFNILLESFECNYVLDLFSGSGTTLISAQENNKICFSIELEPKFIDIILKRYKSLYKDCKIKCLNREFDFKKLFSDLS